MAIKVISLLDITLKVKQSTQSTVKPYQVVQV